jgi:phosphoribosylamine--glycine ligase/phosphoribosylaminoimidazole synthetase
MKVLLIGSGGREHALAWKLSQSAGTNQLFIAPGNCGMAGLGTLVPLKVDDAAGLANFARENKIDLAVIGPEAALEAGVSDALRAAGAAVFGPSQAAAQLETSKRFSKEFMQRHGIPTARFKTFRDYDVAKAYLDEVEYPIVIKASGLAAGKGVILPESIEEARAALAGIMLDLRFGSAGEEVVIEERLTGEEVSLLAFCDGETVAVMPPAQDHKRLMDGDQGPNTGGMGAYAPAPALNADQIEAIKNEILIPTAAGMAAEGNRFVGVLYAGLILTADGPKVLEFNARFGDPETQVILPLLESDLLEVLYTCARGWLKNLEVHWHKGAAVCVVLAAGGYPEKPRSGCVIDGLETPIEDGIVFHAGTTLEDGKTVTSGGRVLGVTAWDDSLRTALKRVYSAVDGIHFDGMQYRKDIAARAMNRGSAYSQAGVDIDAGNKAVELMKEAVKSTYTPRVVGGIGSFGGLFDASNLGDQPVLVASTDGVGTKVELAARVGRVRGVGMDIVNHCINDILVQGARPLFFLDYFASSHLDPVQVAEIVDGMAEACRASGCVLIGGETAEMPGVYLPGAFDIAGTIVGVVERKKMLPRQKAMAAGDLLIGLASNGPHTNGYSLIRKLVEGKDLLADIPELGGSLADALLMPHRSYLGVLGSALPQIKGLAHITGGGFIENIPRMLPAGLQAGIDRSAWQVPPLFRWLQAAGNLDATEIFRVFNMGIGMVGVISPADLEKVKLAVSEPIYVIGELRSSSKKEVIL